MYDCMILDAMKENRGLRKKDSIEIYFFFFLVKERLSDEMMFKGDLKKQRRSWLLKETTVGKGFVFLGTEARMA